MANQIQSSRFSSENKGLRSLNNIQLRSSRAPLRILTSCFPPTALSIKRPLENDSQDISYSTKRARKASQPSFPIYIDPELISTVSEKSVYTKDIEGTIIKDQKPSFWIEILKLSLPKSAYPLLQQPQDDGEDISTINSPILISSRKKATENPIKMG